MAVDGSGNPPLFANNERVLCFHGPLIYEGKTLKTELDAAKDEFKYFIHYAGWNKKWDEWVFESRVLKYIDANLERQKELKQSHEQMTYVDSRKEKETKKKGDGKVSIGGKRKSNVGSSDNVSVTSASDSRSSTPIFGRSSSRGGSFKTDLGDMETTSKKRKRNDDCIESESLFQMKQEVQITLPDELKSLLLEDWDQVVRQGHVIKIPQEKCVSLILADYLKTRRKSDMYAVELCNGLREYFDLMLGNAQFRSNSRNIKCSQLLYNHERDQYLEIHKLCEDSEEPNKKTMSDFYGFTHLLRLFRRTDLAKLGVSLAYTDLDVEAVELLQTCTGELFKYLSKNREVYFSLEDYTAADPEYQRPLDA